MFSNSHWGNNGWSESFSGGCHQENNNNTQYGPEGTHLASCLAGGHMANWTGNNWMNGYYDERCPGCRHDRACSHWGDGNGNCAGRGINGLLAVVGGAYVAKKSLWD